MQRAERPVLAATDRYRGFLVGAAVGAALAAATLPCRDATAVRALLIDGEVPPMAPPPGRRRAALALADELLVDLTGGGVDLHRLAARWLDWAREDGFEADPLLVAGLDHLREFDAPATRLPGGSVAALTAALPAALAGGSPRAMLAGTFHVVRLLDPAETTALAAVAIVVAAEVLLAGRRDFLADVVAALRANDAPSPVLEAIRVIPRDPRSPPDLPGGTTPDPVAVATWLLWTTYHRPRGLDELRELAMRGGVAPTVGALAGALIGARDGTAGWPARWLVETGEAVRQRSALAERLGGA